MSRFLKSSVLCAIAFLAGAALFMFVSSAKADLGGNRDQIYACQILSTGLIRIVSSTSSCDGLLETPLTWRVGPEDGTEFPYVCDSCQFRYVDRFIGRNLTNAWFKNSVMEGVQFINTNLTGANMTEIQTATFSDFQGANLTNVDFTQANLFEVRHMASTTRSGIIWDATTCPDGTNSDDHDRTCEGHF